MLPVIINFTPTGMVPTKLMNQNVPIIPSEIIEQTHEVYEEGITIVHLHARNDDGSPSYKSEIYRNIIEGIRTHCKDLVICISLSGRNFNEFEKRSEAIELLPDMASLTLSSLNFQSQASINDPEMIKNLTNKMNKFGVNPELEIFDLGMMNYAFYLINKGQLRPPHYFNIIFGNIAGMQADLNSMAAITHYLKEDMYWSLGAMGQQQLAANAVSIAIGGGVRVGLEDNLYFDKDKKILATNLNLVKRVKELAAIHERLIMTPSQFGNLGFYNTMK